MTTTDEITTVTLLAKILVLNGNWSAIVYVSVLKTQISWDLLEGSSIDSLSCYYD